MEWIFFNDEFCKKTDVKISPFYDAVMFGQGLFESIRISDGKIEYLDLHILRIKDACKFFSKTYDFSSMNEIIDTLIKKNNALKGVFKCKIIILFDECFMVMLDKVDEIIFDKFILKTHLPVYYEPWPSFKSISYFYYKHITQQFKSENIDNALFLDEKNRILECSSGNIMLFKNNTWIFPTNNGLRLAGVMEHVVKNVLTANRELIEERDVFLDELSSANLFFMNSIKKVISVTEVKTSDAHIR